jgi:hypothetical protein
MKGKPPLALPPERTDRGAPPDLNSTRTLCANNRVRKPKGGVGKSTAPVLLATELATRGGCVTMIDAEANRPPVAMGQSAGET